MPIHSSIEIRNTHQKEVLLRLEPWDERLLMKPSQVFQVIVEAEQPGQFEIDYGENEIVIYGWPSSVLKIFCEGKEICN